MSVEFNYELSDEFKHFNVEMEKLQKLVVYVGYQQGKLYYDENGREVDLADVALFNDLGTATSPSRPFLRNSINNNKQELTKFMGELVKQIMAGMTAEQALKNLGLKQKSLIQDEITDGTYQANATSTIKKKKSSHPLIDTGFMRDNIQFVIKEG